MSQEGQESLSADLSAQISPNNPVEGLQLQLSFGRSAQVVLRRSRQNFVPPCFKSGQQAFLWPFKIFGLPRNPVGHFQVRIICDILSLLKKLDIQANGAHEQVDAAEAFRSHRGRERF